MLFNSYIFILFFLPLTLLLYYVLNKLQKYTAAKVILIAMSLWFYAYFEITYLWIIIASIIFNYLVSKQLQPNKHAIKLSKTLLTLGIFINVGLIFYFKYFNFFLDNMNLLFDTSIPLLSVLMPLGISFFTFQQISYLVDSYRGETDHYSFIDYALFVTFFPQLVAGPIVLHNEMIPQFNDTYKKTLNQDMLSKGIYLFSIGLFKKVLLADTLGNAVNWGFSNINVLTGFDALLVSLMYTLQIYFDFSGYCDMAIGIANMFGFELPLNFNSPYKSASIIEFWQRWHMSLSRFLRKYIYFPLGGSKKGSARTICNVLIVFLVSGIWHGANWTFILWGLLHGVANVLTRLFHKPWEYVPKCVRIILTFIFVNFAWILFRSDSLTDCLNMFRHIFFGWGNGAVISDGLLDNFHVIELTYIEEHVGFLTNLIAKIPSLNMWLILLVSLFLVFFTKNCHEKEYKPTVLNAILCIILLVWSVMSLSGLSTFLYFNF